ncbi:MAG: D-2-hydroxyacid dehydrogenase [Acetobacteraceae bacterium]|nr:D-2-hydroxyacid dehydrogenase [Acetobacteraceae bacterium]
MRIHLQSYPGSANFPLTQAVWDEAAARAPDVSAGHALSFGDTREAFEAGMRDAELLVAQTSSLVPGLPPSPRLQLIYVTSAGLEKLAPYDWLPDGVPLLNNRGTHAAKAGEFGLMALLMLANWVPLLFTAQREGRWAQKHGTVLAGHRVLVIGLGTLGGAIAGHARDFGMYVTGVRTRAEPHPACERVVAVGDLEAVLPEAEFLVLAAPLTPATKGLLSRERIALLPRGAGVVNVGRGAVADQDALLDALDGGHLGGAVLDVFDLEPIPPGHRLWSTRNLVITPHTSADDPNTYNARSLDIFFENLRAWQQGRPLPNRFDVNRGY